MHLSDFEKRIYNEYLRASRRGKPYTLRKNFEGISDETYVNIKKLAAFFHTFPHIQIREYFDAGFVDTEFQQLKFFRTLRATKMYNAYMADKISTPDNEWNINFVRNSLLFIYLFCKERKISVENYVDELTPAGHPWCFIHLKEFKVCIYALLGFDTFENKLSRHFDDIKGIVLPEDFCDSLPRLRTAFFASKKCKTLVREGLKAIKKTKQQQKEQDHNE